jgi:membrane-associated protease RseP (regulator of RpoE activity)
MKRMRSLGRGLTFSAITTLAMGAGSRLVAQDQPATEKPSNPPAATEQPQRAADQTGRQPDQSRDQTEQGRPIQQAGHQDSAPGHRGLGIQFETQASSGRGIEIANVAPNSAAEQAGLRAHDRLISIDGRPFKHHRHAKAYLTAQTGRPVPLIIERDGRQYMIQYVVGQPEGDSGWVGILLYGENEMAPNGPIQSAAQPSGPDGSQNAQNTQNPPGNNPTPSSPTQNAPGQPGARVAQIYPGSPAARAGLQPGDLVTQINGQKIDDPAELIALVHEMKPQTQAEFEIMRENQPQKIPVTIGSRASEFAESQYGPGQGQQASGQDQAGPDPNALQRIEQEMRQLRDEIRQLREQLQKK